LALPSVTYFFSLLPKKVGKKKLGIAKVLVAPEGAAAEVFEFKCNVLINNNLFFKKDQEGVR